MDRNHLIKVSYILLVILIFGCSSHASTPNTSSTTSMISLTLTPSPNGEVATVLPSPSPKLHPTVVPSITIFPTKTTEASLSAEDMMAMVFDLLQDNGGCRLPCLWGQTPGKTDSIAFNDFLALYKDSKTPDIYTKITDYGDLGNIFLAHRNNNVLINVRFGYLKDIASKLQMLSLHGYSMLEQGKDLDWLSPEISPIYGNASFNQAFQYYMLPQILSNYGPPGEVLLAPFPDEPNRSDITWYPFSLVLFYPDQGIFVEYVSPREKNGDQYQWCPTKTHITLTVWSPESSLSLKDVVQKAGSEINELNMDYFRPVEEVSSMSLNDFYEKFKDPENTACLETPVDLWQ